MAEFPTYEQMAKDVAEKALDEYQINGKTLREWITFIAEQEPCEDCISRQAAISAIEALQRPIMREASDYYQFKFSGMSEAREVVVNLPSVTPKSKTEWIPCSERLPGKDGCYLVTTTGTNNDIIDIAYYTDDIWHKASRIKAWMPLPEPYKESEVDE